MFLTADHRENGCRQGRRSSSEFVSAVFPPTVTAVVTGPLRGGWLTGGAALIQRSNSHQSVFWARRCRISLSNLRPRSGLPRCWRATKRASA